MLQLIAYAAQVVVRAGEPAKLCGASIESASGKGGQVVCHKPAGGTAIMPRVRNDGAARRLRKRQQLCRRIVPVAILVKLFPTRDAAVSDDNKKSMCVRFDAVILR